MIAALCGFGVLVPLGYLLIRAGDADQTELAELLLRRRNLTLLTNTALLTFSVVGVVSALALPAAWLTTRCRLWGRSLWTVLLVLPLAVPGYLMAFTLLALGGPYGSSARLIGVKLPVMSGYFGALLALSLYLFPYLFLTLRAAFLRLDDSLHEVARSLGAGPARVFVRVTIPQLLPGYGAGALLVALHVIGDFGVVSLMRFETFSFALYQQYTGSFDRVYAAWIALMLLAFSSVFVVGELALARNLRLERIGVGVRRVRKARDLGWWNLAVWLGLSLIVIGGVVVPVATILYWMSQGSGLAAGWFSEVQPALWNAARVSGMAAVLATSLAIPIVSLAVRYPSWFTRFLERLVYLGYAVPPLAFGLGLIFFSLRAAPILYQTLAVLIGAYVLHFLAEAIGPLRSVWFSAERRQEEASRALGVGRWGTFWRVTFPIVRSGVVVALAFVFLSCMKELPLTVLLAPIGFETLAYNVWDFTNEAMYAEAAPSALAIVLTCGLFVGLLLLRRKDKG